MITLGELYILKESTEGHNVVYLNICDQEFVFRTLGVKEYLDILSCMHIDKDVEDAICQCTVIYPENYRFSESPYSGISEIASKIIKNSSGIDNEDLIMDTLNSEKQSNCNFHSQCVNLIKAVFSEINYEDILEWPWEKIIKYATRAESILNIKGINVQLIDNRENLESESENEYSQEEIVKELRNQGIDPMKYYSNRFLNPSKDIVDFPLIGGIHWNKEEILFEIRKQMGEKK